jgi:hypothetical protein
MSTRAAMTGALVVAFCLIAVPSAFAAASYVFEPTLSLTGNCSVSPLDEVPDPGPCPGTPEVDHPSAGFKSPSVTTDSYGDIYVVSMIEKEARIDIFDPEGFFISEFKDPAGPQSIAVDKEGNVYFFERLTGGERQVRRFPPTVYKPLQGEIEYGAEPVVLTNESTKELLPLLGPESSLDVDRLTGRVYFNNGFTVSVFGSAAEENKLLEKEALEAGERTGAIAVDSVHKKIYLSVRVPITHKSIIRVYELESPHKELGQITGSTTPKGEFLSAEGLLAVDVDDNTGHVFVGDIPSARKVYEFEEDGTYLATIEHSFEVSTSTGGIAAEIAVDDGQFSPKPQLEGWLFVPSFSSPSLGHLFAFEPNEERKPEVEAASVSDVTETEATLHATINPGGVATEYRLEYISLQQYEEEGESFANAAVAGAGTLPKGAEGVAVSTTASELEPGTVYLFHVLAENAKGNDEAERLFITAEEEVVPPGGCANEELRTGLSALLPDCRAYELVTPPDTNGHPPTAGFSGLYGFPTLRVAPDGNRATFLIEGGTLPGEEGAGPFNGDPYHSTRTAGGWTTQLAGPTGDEATGPQPGSVSPDQTYSFWRDIKGPVVHIRYPDGHSELVGKGSLGETPVVGAELITENASHIVFSTTAHLEPDAAPEGTATVYDRSAEGPTRVVSLLPGDEPQEAGENAKYLGASEGGEGIAFEIGGTIYLRLHNAETLEVAGPDSTFAGVADEGRRVFYLEGGDLLAFDAQAEEAISFSSSGDVTPVNVATGGTRAYFVSPSVLTGEPNPEGEEAEGGAENLYLSEEGTISFVGVVTERDVEGEKRIDGLVGGLGLWIEGIKQVAPAKDPSRTTPAGTTLLFESRADLTGFESEGFAQVYRYDSSEERLDCLSCSPTNTPPSSDASLQSISEEQFSTQPGGSILKISNQSPDGKRAFFQTAEPLVLGDTDGQLDVYEWEEESVGGCETEGGCIYLISGGQSPSPDYLWGMSTSGDDVFFRTADQLLPRDVESTLSIYDARVGGGFAEPSESTPCAAIDTCQPTPTPAPILPVPGAQTPSEGNVSSPKTCPKGKHKAKRNGKVVCVKKHHKKKHHHRAGQKKKGASR